MDEILFDAEGIRFKYLSNWREQNTASVGPNCIKALVKVVEGNPSTITVYKNDAGDNQAVAPLEEPMKKSFESQGWTVTQSRILNLNGLPVYNIVADAQGNEKMLENQTTVLINDGFMYIFEFMHFKDFPHTISDFLAVMDSIEFPE